MIHVRLDIRKLYCIYRQNLIKTKNLIFLSVPSKATEDHTKLGLLLARETNGQTPSLRLSLGYCSPQWGTRRGPLLLITHLHIYWLKLRIVFPLTINKYFCLNIFQIAKGPGKKNCWFSFVSLISHRAALPSLLSPVYFYITKRHVLTPGWDRRPCQISHQSQPDISWINWRPKFPIKFLFSVNKSRQFPQAAKPRQSQAVTTSKVSIVWPETPWSNITHTGKM